MTAEVKYSKRFLALNTDSSVNETKEAYDEMAAAWETISDNVGYRGHFLCVEAFDKEMLCNNKKDIKILDAGAGTGGIGEMLKARGYKNIDALDISQEMLDLAAKKNIYKNLICAPLSDTRLDQIETAEYDVVLCAGTIVYGQVKPGAIAEVARYVKPGGLFIFTIRVDSFDPEEYGFSLQCKELEDNGKLKLVHKEKRELHSTPNEERFRYCYLITYQVLK